MAKALHLSAQARTMREVVRCVSDRTGVPQTKVEAVFEALAEEMGSDLRRGVPFVIPKGLAKVEVRRRPATAARKGLNPFTGEPTTFKAKPATATVKVRAMGRLKALADKR